MSPWLSSSRLFPSACAIVAGVFVCAPARLEAAPKSKADAPVPATAAFDRDIHPLLVRYCTPCHGANEQKGGLALHDHAGKSEAQLVQKLDLWQAVGDRVNDGEMPPEGKPRPTATERERFTSWIHDLVGHALTPKRPDPGRVTIRRLNRAEYNNSIRDLFGIDLRPADDFPSDEVGYGFDNIGDVLSIPPVLVERYLTAAERITSRVIAAQVPPVSRQETVSLAGLPPLPRGSRPARRWLVMNSPGALGRSFEVPIEGHYTISVRAAGQPLGGAWPRLSFQIDGKATQTFEVRTRAGQPAIFSAEIELGPGARRIAVVAVEPGTAVPKQVRSPPLRLEWLRLEGPDPSKPWALPPSHRLVIPQNPTPDRWRQQAREFLAPIASRAYRRPIEPEEIEALAAFVERTVHEGGTFEEGVQVALQAILVAPQFIYRAELEHEAEAKGPEVVPLGDFEIAARLSYFLWSSLPDEALFSLARGGVLRDPGVLEGQVRRMLRDPKAAALVEGFTTQWLQLRNLDTAVRPRKFFPSFDEPLRAAMLKESLLFFETVLRHDLALRTFLDADFTLLNERLARHYGIEGVAGDHFQRITLVDRNRGGLVTQASVLTVTSNAGRTSPVKRGRWVLEQILGTPPPEPPPSAPPLSATKRDKNKPTTLRARLEQHRSDPDCAVCHKKMDPLGFALESFDAVGAFRTHESDGLPIDASGVLPGGQAFEGPGELKKVLLAKEEQFRRAFASKLLTYALGRGLEAYDRPAVDRILAEAAAGGDSITSLATAIVKSDPFQKRRRKQGRP